MYTGGEAQSDKQLPQSPFSRSLFRWRHFANAFYESYLSRVTQTGVGWQLEERHGQEQKWENDELQSIVGRWQICRTEIFQIYVCGIWPKISILFQGLDLKFWVLPGEFGTGICKSWPYWRMEMKGTFFIWRGTIQVLQLRLYRIEPTILGQHHKVIKNHR